MVSLCQRSSFLVRQRGVLTQFSKLTHIDRLLSPCTQTWLTVPQSRLQRKGSFFIQKAKDHFLNLKEFQRKAMELVTRKLCMISLHLPCQSLLVKKPMSVNMSWDRARTFFPIKIAVFLRRPLKTVLNNLQLATANQTDLEISCH